jgi:hypothetical protein
MEKYQMDRETSRAQAIEPGVDLDARPQLLPLSADIYLSRRSLFHFAVVTAAMVAITATPAAAQIKISQAAVGYQDHPSGDRQCATCTHFRAPNQCQLIGGSISPQGWCRLFAPKSGTDRSG